MPNPESRILFPSFHYPLKIEIRQFQIDRIWKSKKRYSGGGRRGRGGPTRFRPPISPPERLQGRFWIWNFWRRVGTDAKSVGPAGNPGARLWRVSGTSHAR